MNYFIKRHTKDFLLYLAICLGMAMLVVGDSIVVAHIVKVAQSQHGYLFPYVALGTISFVALQAIGYFLQGYVSERLSKRWIQNLRQDLFLRFLFSGDFRKGEEELAKEKAVLTTQLESLDQLYLQNFFWGMYLLMQFLVAILVALWMKPVFVFAILLLSIPSILIPIVWKGRIGKARGDIIEGQENTLTSMVDFLDGRRNIKMLQAEKSIQREMDCKEKDLFQRQVQGARTTARVDMMSRFTSAMVFYGIWLLGAYFILLGKMELPELVGFIQLVGSITVPLNLFLGISTALISGEKILEYILTFLPEVEEEEGNHFPKDFQRIELRNVTLEKEGKQILRQISATFNLKEKVLILGDSGSGKSTLLETILVPDRRIQGDIFLDGINRKEISDQEIFGQIGYFSQKNHIFKATVRENLTMFQEGASDGELLDSLQKVGLSTWIQEKTLDGQLDNHSFSLSGGERQRFLLARLLLSKKGFLILDEVTSGLDRGSVREIENLLLSIPQGFLMVSHNVSDKFCSQVDTIYTMEEGRLKT